MGRTARANCKARANQELSLLSRGLHDRAMEWVYSPRRKIVSVSICFNRLQNLNIFFLGGRGCTVD